MTDDYDFVKKALEKLPDTPENLKRASQLIRYLKTDHIGFSHIADIEDGIFNAVIPDLKLAAYANNLFIILKQQYNLKKFNDLEMLYFKVITIVKELLLSRHYFKAQMQMIDSPELSPNNLNYLTALQRLDNWLANLHIQYQKGLSLTRDQRMAKIIKQQDSDGNSLVMMLSKIATEDIGVENNEIIRKKKKTVESQT